MLSNSEAVKVSAVAGAAEKTGARALANNTTTISQRSGKADLRKGEKLFMGRPPMGERKWSRHYRTGKGKAETKRESGMDTQAKKAPRTSQQATREGSDNGYGPHAPANCCTSTMSIAPLRLTS